jgi:hypothetical protein
MNATPFRSARQNADNYPASEHAHKGIVASTSAEYQRAVIDQALCHCAVRVFVLLTEFSWWFEWGGDGHGGIMISIDDLAREVGVNTKFLRKWLRQLERGNYIWTDKIPQRSGYAAAKYFIQCLVPKPTQRELPLVGSSAHGPVGSSAHGPVGSSAHGPVGSNGHSPVVTTAHLKEVKEVIGKGVPDSPRSDLASQPENNEDDPTGFKRWRAKLERLYPNEIREKLSLLKVDQKKLQTDTRNFKRGEMRPELADFIKHAKSALPKLEASKKAPDKIRAADYRRKIESLEAAEDSYTRGPLLPSAAAEQANITRKIQALQEALR